MEIGDRVVVVTGGAMGIGASLCRRFASEGARGVVVADVEEAGAQTVAAEIGGLAVRTDVSQEADVRRLVEMATAQFGPIDLFCSNAGIFTPGGVETPDADWERIFNINFKAHLYAARAVVPGMVARGEGYLLQTVSAAGLLTQIGSAPYAVTKHAAVALAEWLSISYGDRGICVSCLCPQAVTTNLGATSLREVAGLVPAPADTGAIPAAAGNGSVSRQASVDGVLTPDRVAASVLAAVADERFLILPHPEVATYERRRAEDRDRWLGGMRRLQGRLAGRS